MSLIYLFFLFLLIITLNKFLLKKNVLLSETGDGHQKFASLKKVPLTGGIFIFLGYFYLINENIYSFIIFSGTILILGIFSDLKLIKSASIRLFFQILLVFSYIIFNNVQINDTRIFLLDELLNNNIINYFFITFCVLIVINGSNFIDGLNTLNVGYYLFIGLIIFLLNLNKIIIIHEISFLYILSLLIFIFLLNIFNKIYLGDSGAYLLGFTFSVFLIDIYNLNQTISPFFIILLLWYPCYENLFSILRKKKLNAKSPMEPDNNHFHQLIFFFLKKKYKLEIFTSNVLSSQIINFYNLLIFVIGGMFISKTNMQAFLILFSITIYSFTYYKLYVFKKKSRDAI